jgi:hypothetical protein
MTKNQETIKIYNDIRKAEYSVRKFIEFKNNLNHAERIQMLNIIEKLKSASIILENTFSGTE